MTDDEREILSGIEGRVGVIRLNRPRAINALTHEMCRTMSDVLGRWRDDERVESVLLESTTERGLCSGGDVRAVREVALAGEYDRALSFWQDEYDLDAAIGAYPKPVTVFMDGVVMGGGVGLSAYASRRIATDRTRLAMPETAIGYFPDVAATWLLARAPGELGTHVAMTGATVSGADAVALGLADHVVPATALAGIRRELVAGREPSFGSGPASALATQRGWIDECYAGDDPLRIVTALAEHPDPAAREAADLIRSRSPLSVALALATVRQAAGLPDQMSTLARDQRLNARMLTRSDFLEGVRTVLVDKGAGQPPRWLHPRLEDVPAAVVADMLA